MQLIKSAVPASLDSNIIYQAGELSHAVHELLARRFKGAGISLTVEQFGVLAALFYRDGISQKEIGVMLNRDRTTMARVISNMEKNKLIRRVSDDEDSRIKRVYLTTRGRSAQKKAVGISGNVYAKALTGIGARHLKICCHVLTIMLTNVSAKDNIE
jgi:DNA-binding MarR family transcriptional regulator